MGPPPPTDPFCLKLVLAGPKEEPVLAGQMSVKVEFVAPISPSSRVVPYPRFTVTASSQQFVDSRKRRHSRPAGLLLPVCRLPPTNMLSQEIITPAQQPQSAKPDLADSRSRDGLRLNFHRSISEPQGQRTVIKGLCPPDVVVVSPPSCAPSLHPSKRCKLTTALSPDSISADSSKTEGSYKRRPPCLPSLTHTAAATPQLPQL